MSQAPYTDHLEYLGDWFQIVGSPLQIEDSKPNTQRLELFSRILERAQVTIEAGIPIPFEDVILAHGLSQTERTIILILLRDAINPFGELVSNLPFLLQCLREESLPGQLAVRRLLEEESGIRRLGFIECDQDPVPARRLYRLNPRWIQVLLGKSKNPYVLPEVPSNELQAFEQLDLLAAQLNETPRGPALAGKCFWSGPALNGPGWDSLFQPRSDLLLYLRALACSEHRFGRIVRETGLSPADVVALSSIVSFYHRTNSGYPVPAFVDFMNRARPGGKEPLRFLDSGSRLSHLISLEPEGGVPAKQRIAVVDPVRELLVPYTIKMFELAPSIPGDDEPKLPLIERRKPRLTLEGVVLEPEARLQITRALRERDCLKFLSVEWGFDSVATASTGTALLFHGAPGTGKTLTAEAIAGELGTSLSVLRTEGIMSRWVGSSDRNMKEALKKAKETGDVLLIDEADSLIGNRDTDSRRHEVSLTNLLLQEIEQFRGVIILTTNREASLDPALERRLTAKVEFRVPGPAERKQLWRRYIPEQAPLSSSVDLDALAHRHVLTGATIRLACLAAATAAFEREGGKAMIRQHDLEEAATSQSRKKSWPPVVGFTGTHRVRHPELHLVQAAALPEESGKLA